MVLALVLQLIGLGDFEFGGEVDYDIDAPDFDADSVEAPSAGFGGAVLTLLGLGRVPLITRYRLRIDVKAEFTFA